MELVRTGFAVRSRSIVERLNIKDHIRMRNLAPVEMLIQIV